MSRSLSRSPMTYCTVRMMHRLNCGRRLLGRRLCAVVSHFRASAIARLRVTAGDVNRLLDRSMDGSVGARQVDLEHPIDLRDALELRPDRIQLVRRNLEPG